jgi:phosphonate transport system substrate-binding protein
MLRLAPLLLLSCQPTLPESSLKKWPIGSASPAVVLVSPTLQPPRLKKVRVAMAPVIATAELHRIYAPLLKYLTVQLGIPFQLEVTGSYEELVSRARSGEADLMSLPPRAYLQLSKQGLVRCLTHGITEGSSTTSGYVFVRSDSKIQDLDGLNGARVAFVDPNSMSGHLMQLKLLQSRGIDVAAVARQVRFEGSHQAVVEAVLSQTADVGATNQSIFHALKKSGGLDLKRLRIIGKTARIPLEVFCVNTTVNDELAQHIQQLLLGLNASPTLSQEILKPLDTNGFAPFSAAVFAGLDELYAAP